MRAPPGDILDYADQVLQRLRQCLGDELLGAYLIGSTALGDYVPARSDVDILAVCTAPLEQDTKSRIVGLLSHPTLPCPARGCEFVLYSKAAVATPSPGAAFELNLNSGPRMPFHVAYYPDDEPAHWFVLDRAVARERGLRLLGPEPHPLIAPIPRPWLLDAITALLRWHAEHERAGPSSVLNACRGWRFAEESQWSSKAEAAQWARIRLAHPALVDHALALRAGSRDDALNPTSVEAFIHDIEARVERIRQRERIPPLST